MAFDNYGATYLKLLKDMKQNQYAARGQFRSDILGMARGIGDRQAEQAMNTERIASEQGMQTERLGADATEAEKARGWQTENAINERASEWDKLMAQLKNTGTLPERTESEISIAGARSAADKEKNQDATKDIRDFLDYLYETDASSGLEYDTQAARYINDQLKNDPSLQENAVNRMEAWMNSKNYTETMKQAVRDEWNAYLSGKPITANKKEEAKGTPTTDLLGNQKTQLDMDLQAKADELWKLIKDKPLEVMNKTLITTYNVTNAAGTMSQETKKGLLEKFNKAIKDLGGSTGEQPSYNQMMQNDPSNRR